MGRVFQEGDVEAAGDVGCCGDLVGPGAVAQQLASMRLDQDLLHCTQPHTHDECTLNLQSTLTAQSDPQHMHLKLMLERVLYNYYYNSIVLSITVT